MRGSGIGDLLCKVIVETPVKLTTSSTLLQELKIPQCKHSPRGKSWFDGVKSFFDELKPAGFFGIATQTSLAHSVRAWQIWMERATTYSVAAGVAGRMGKTLVQAIVESESLTFLI